MKHQIVFLFISGIFHTILAAEKPETLYESMTKQEDLPSYLTPEEFATFSPDYQAQYAYYVTADDFLAHSPCMHLALIRLMPTTKLTALRDSYLEEERHLEQKKIDIVFSKKISMKHAIEELNAWYAAGNLEKSNFRQNIIEQLTNNIALKKAETHLFEPLLTPPPSPITYSRSRSRTIYHPRVATSILQDTES